jgi:hydroxymethylglutaryl-CoA reductase (NADPH)
LKLKGALVLRNFSHGAICFLGCRSSRFARLQGIHCGMAGKNLYIRFSCSTGDAMGMNMVSKGVQNVLDFLQSDFPDMDVIGISG